MMEVDRFRLRSRFTVFARRGLLYTTQASSLAISCTVEVLRASVERSLGHLVVQLEDMSDMVSADTDDVSAGLGE